MRYEIALSDPHLYPCGLCKDNVYQVLPLQSPYKDLDLSKTSLHNDMINVTTPYHGHINRCVDNTQNECNILQYTVQI